MVWFEAVLRGVGGVAHACDYLLLAHLPSDCVPSDVTADGSYQNSDVHIRVHSRRFDIRKYGYCDIVQFERCCKSEIYYDICYKLML